MNYRFLMLIWLSLLAACGSPADDIAFKAPPGWNSTPGIMGRFQMWMHDRSMVMLVRGDKRTSVMDAEHSAPGTSNIRDYHARDITICEDQKAQYFTGNGESTTNGKTQQSAIEGIITDVNDARYFALYVRPKGNAPDGQAEAALRSVCKK